MNTFIVPAYLGNRLGSSRAEKPIPFRMRVELRDSLYVISRSSLAYERRKQKGKNTPTKA
jgi:hypothetical protein